MKNKLIAVYRELIRRIVIAREYFYDALHYSKWNYNRVRIRSLPATEARMLRQAHVLEKGMSLESPRAGFGQQKAIELIEMLERYLALGFSVDRGPIRIAIGTLFAYIAYHADRGVTNETINSRAEIFRQHIDNSMASGVTRISKEVMITEMKKDFESFFKSRRTVRQFSGSEVNFESVKKAVALAMHAPSACNRQSSKVYMFRSNNKNEIISKYVAGNTGFADDVYRYLIVTADASAFHDAFERNQMYIDGALFSMALVESLHYYGIASCMLQNGEIHRSEKKFRSDIEAIPPNEKIIMFIGIGGYKEHFEVAASQRKHFEEVFRYVN